MSTQARLHLKTEFHTDDQEDLAHLGWIFLQFACGLSISDTGWKVIFPLAEKYFKKPERDVLLPLELRLPEMDSDQR